MSKVLLLNPPATQRVVRDLYCGHLAKGSYYWPQIDLLVLSGMLHDAGHQLALLDAVVDDMSPASASRHIDEIAPDIIVALVAALSWSEDVAFLSRLRERHAARIVVSGDFPRADPRRALDLAPCIDAVILDFADCDITGFARDPSRTGLKNIHTRGDEGPPCVSRDRSFSFPLPRHELYDHRKYHSPHVLHRPFTGVLTDYGCPYRCDYCYFERIGHKRRNLENLREELVYVRSLGIREIILQDLSFGALKSHAMQVCEVMRSVADDFSWVCEFRADSADEELLRSMRAAGCHTLMIGVESPNEVVMAKHHKPQPVRQVEDAFALARRLGFRTLAHFIIGLSGETPESIEELIRFSIALNPDIASFNVARPAWDTGFRDEVVREGWMLDDGIEIAAADSLPIWETPQLRREQMWQLRNDAVRRFYLRPSFILGQLTRVRTPYHASILVREGWHIVREAAGRAFLGDRRGME